MLAFGRGVPRRFDIPGKVQGLAFGLTVASKYVGEPVLVIGGGTSAAEAVIAISSAKNDAGDSSDVYWSYRGDKMPKVSRALADPFFQAFVGNGNVRYLPSSEPVAVLEVADESYLSVRTSRIMAQGLSAGDHPARVPEDVLHRLHRRGHSRGNAHAVSGCRW